MSTWPPRGIYNKKIYTNLMYNKQITLHATYIRFNISIGQNWSWIYDHLVLNIWPFYDFGPKFYLFNFGLYISNQITIGPPSTIPLKLTVNGFNSILPKLDFKLWSIFYSLINFLIILVNIYKILQVKWA